jgi:transposase-like protein
MTIQEKKKAASCKPGRAMRLLRGEDLELLSRELGVVASTLSLWREHFLTAGQTTLKIKKGQFDVRDEQINRLKKKVGELTMENELLQEKAERLEAGLPLARTVN